MPLTIKCICGVNLNYNKVDFTLSKEKDKNLALIAVECPNCKERIALMATSATRNDIIIAPKEEKQ